MTVPAYHLRPNKAVDRLALMEAIRRLDRLDGKGLQGYTYYGLGGPYLEDFRLLYESYPKIGMVSIEEDSETRKRQEFNRPCSTLKIIPGSMNNFIKRYNPGSVKSIFWLDYTRLESKCFDDFQNLLGSVASISMIKITLPSDPDDLLTENKSRAPDLIAEFLETFRRFLVDPHADPPRNVRDFACFLQDMVQMAAEDSLPAPAKGRMFVPVSSFYYADGKPMFTLTGIVCRGSEEAKVKKAFEDWEHANMSWDLPKRISMPVLSTKERLRLQPLLPDAKEGRDLREELGYYIGDPETADDALTQYAKFHRHAPYFLKGVP